MIKHTPSKETFKKCQFIYMNSPGKVIPFSPNLSFYLKTPDCYAGNLTIENNLEQVLIRVYTNYEGDDVFEIYDEWPLSWEETLLFIDKLYEKIVKHAKDDGRAHLRNVLIDFINS